MKTILTYGTFDLFHVGHVRLLKRVRGLGDRLIVGCSTDEFNAGKGKTSVFSYEQRAEILQGCRYVDVVIPENSWEQKEDDIRKFAVDTFVIGDDWAGKFDFLAGSVDVFYVPRTDGVSTTDIKSVLTSEQEQKLVQIRNLMSTATDLLKSL
jgi:glycerol-3-phosphate cytidylyltransferase